MTSCSPQPIVDLWPSLGDGQREALIEIARAAATLGALRLSIEEKAALDRSKADYLANRTFSMTEAKAATDAYLAARRSRR